MRLRILKRYWIHAFMNPQIAINLRTICVLYRAICAAKRKKALAPFTPPHRVATLTETQVQFSVTRAASKRQISISYPLMWMVLAFGICLPISSYGWGANGHRFITDTAVEELPPPLKSFFQANKTAFKDKAATEPAGNHFIDIDYYPEFFSHTFPHDVNALIAKYGSAIVSQNGMAPWTAVDNYNTLRASFAAAQTQADWTNLLTIAGATAHYLEDLHNPMHLAMNYDGRLTGQNGLHSRYETTLVGYRIGAGLSLVTNTNACVYYSSLLDAIFADVDLVYPDNAPLLAADLTAYRRRRGPYLHRLLSVRFGTMAAPASLRR